MIYNVMKRFTKYNFILEGDNEFVFWGTENGKVDVNRKQIF